MWGLEIDKWISFPFVKSFQSQQSRGKAHLPSSSMVRSSSLAETRSSNSSWVGERPLVCSEYLQRGFCQHFQSSCFRIFDQHLQLIASVCIDIVYKPKQMRIIVLFLVLFADLEGHLPNNLNWTNTWPVSRNHVIKIDWLWTFLYSLAPCHLYFFWVLLYRLKISSFVHFPCSEYFLMEPCVTCFTSLKKSALLFFSDRSGLRQGSSSEWKKPRSPVEEDEHEEDLVPLLDAVLGEALDQRQARPQVALVHLDGRSQMLIFLCSVDVEI